MGVLFLTDIHKEVGFTAGWALVIPVVSMFCKNSSIFLVVAILFTFPVGSE